VATLKKPLTLKSLQGSLILNSLQGNELVKHGPKRQASSPQNRSLTVGAAHDGPCGVWGVQPGSATSALLDPAYGLTAVWERQRKMSAPSPLQSATCIRSSSGVSENGSLATAQPRPRPSTMLRTCMMAVVKQLTNLQT